MPTTYHSYMFLDRQAIRQNLEAKITPMLAAIVSLADVNAGMDVLSDNDSSSAPWVHRLFLRMLHDPRVVTLTYTDIQSSALQKVELSEMPVRSTGCDGAVFRAKLPFSWVIKNQVDMLVHPSLRVTGINYTSLIMFTKYSLIMYVLIEKY